MTDQPVPAATRYRRYGGGMDPDPEGQWVHVGDLGVKEWMLDPLAPAPTAPAGLREVEDAMLAIANLPFTKERGDRLLTVIRAAIASLSGEPGLDVERLAEAMLVAFGDLVGTVNETPREVWRKRAVILAAEYASLGTPSADIEQALEVRG